MNIFKQLGLEIHIENWEKTSQLPNYILNQFHIYKATIHYIECITLEPKTDLPTIPTLKKQIEKIQNIDNLPIFIKVKEISLFRKENL